MGKYIVYAIAFGCLIACSSCEKLDIEDYIKKNNLSDNTTTGGGSESIKEDGEVQTEGAVDLGLSVKWAAQNLIFEGFAGSCSEIGDEFNWSTNYISSPPQEIGGTSFDCATHILGENWQTPSEEQWKELIDNCRLHYTVYEDAIGYVVTGKTGKAIFIPMETKSDESSYWSSTSYYDDYSQYARTYLYTLTNSGITQNYEYNNNYTPKYHIRPVERNAK